MADAPTTEIQRRAQRALTRSPISDIRCLHVEHQEGRLIISGSVSWFYHKQMAQEIVRTVCGDAMVVNSIEVR